MMGGAGTYNDVWRSTDKGLTWVRVNASAGWSARFGHASVVIPICYVILMGGTNYKTDVWQFDPTGSLTQNPSHTYSGAPQSFNVTEQAYNAVGYNATIKNNYVTIYGNPIVKFAMQSTIGTGQSFVTLTDTSLNVTASNWSFQNVTGNNTQVWFSQSWPTTTIPLHAGNWSMVENASNIGASNTSAAQWLNVSAVTASFSGTPLSGQTPFSVSFTDASSGSPSQRAWFFGDENYTQGWTVQNTSSGWSKRTGHSVVVMPDGNIILIAGTSGVSDVWRSSDAGLMWVLMNASAPWSARYAQSAVALPDGNIVMTGGAVGGTATKNDTWRSTDEGNTWRLMNASSGWSQRGGHSTVVAHDGSIILTGGSTIYETANHETNDTWRSTDEGATWQLMNASGGWHIRGWHNTVLMHDGSIGIIGGGELEDFPYRLNDTWRSTDNGATWTLINASAPWIAKDHKGAVVMPDNSILLIEGNAGTPPETNDTWRSTDEMVTWTEINASPSWNARYDTNPVLMPEGSLVIFGGQGDNGLLNDTWRMQPVGSNAQNPTHQYTTQGIYSVSEMVTGSFGSNTLTKSSYINIFSSLPVVIFDSNVTNGQYPLNAQFYDQSAGIPISWNWSFGDGSYSNLQNPAHTYSGYGQYSVNLTVTNIYGTTFLNKQNYITVNVASPLIITSFSGTPASGLASLPVSFADTSLALPYPVTSWLWNFGDGGTSTLQNPSYTYINPGTYSVSLTTSNANVTNSTTYSNYITVTAPIPSTAFIKSFTSNATYTGININRYNHGTLSLFNPDTMATISVSQTISYLPDSTTLDTIPIQPAIAFYGDDGSYWIYRTV
jgi:PKD repeat protein